MRFGGGLPVHCCLSPHQYTRDMGLSREFVCVRGEGTNGFFPPEECENQMTAEPSASPSGVCPSLPAGSNYVGSRLCYRRADDDAVSLCDAPQQASALPRRLGFGRFPQSRDKQRAVMLAKEPRSQGWRWDGARFKQVHGQEYRKVDGTVCARCMELGAMARSRHRPRPHQRQVRHSCHHPTITGTVPVYLPSHCPEVVSFLLPVPGWLPWFCFIFQFFLP